MTYEADPVLLVLLIASNVALAVASFAIPAAMAWIALRSRKVPFPLMGSLFAGFFLISCVRHLCAVLIFFRPAWHLLTFFSCFAAMVSSATAVLLWVWRRRIADTLGDYRRFAETMKQAAQ